MIAIEKMVDPESVTLQECIDLHDRFGISVIVENGRVSGFLREGGDGEK